MKKKVKEKKQRGKLFKIFAATGIVLGSVVGICIGIVGGYVIYLSAQYYRIPDDTKLEVENNKQNQITAGRELTFTSYNIGFGAYSHDYTFCMDEGYMEDGTKTIGVHGKARSEEETIFNIETAINAMKSLNSDFYAIQEVDLDSDRTYHINQKEMIQEEFNDYGRTYTLNFHSGWLFYPFFDFDELMGTINSGLLTLSRYQIDDAVRKSYVIDESFPTKFFDLDRCFSINKIPVNNGKNLYLINSHMSAYDEGGVVRNAQIQQLNTFLKSLYENGDYIVLGGDFNHDLLTNNPLNSYDLENKPFSGMYTQLTPDWVSYLFDEDKTSPFDEAFNVYAASNYPTLRGADIEYEKGVTFVSTVDGFLVSDNVEVVSVETLCVGNEEVDMFLNSDHQPTTLKFKLN